jgi:mannose PTS system EIIA component
MTALLIVAHAPLASALLTVARHVYADCSHALAAVDVQPGSTLEDVEASIRAALDGLAAQEVLVLTDVFGATPCNAALAVADGRRMRVVAGVNVPMLWRTLCYADAPLDDLLDRALAGAAQGVMPVSVPRRQVQPAVSVNHDQVQHHHQQ